MRIKNLIAKGYILSYDVNYRHRDKLHIQYTIFTFTCFNETCIYKEIFESLGIHRPLITLKTKSRRMYLKESVKNYEN